MRYFWRRTVKPIIQYGCETCQDTGWTATSDYDGMDWWYTCHDPDHSKKVLDKRRAVCLTVADTNVHEGTEK